MSDFRFGPYISVAQRRQNAERTVAKMRRAGKNVKPVTITGNTIAYSFWGKAWCQSLETYSDYASRLPRGRSYARHGAIIDLQIAEGKIDALVMGSANYKVQIRIKALPRAQWTALRNACAGQINSLVELLAGKLSHGVMDIVSRPDGGLFPEPQSIELGCSCPDWAVMCKHVAAVLYGIGARLDHEPQMLFTLRGVDPAELIEAAIDRGVSVHKKARGRVLKADDLSAIFGVDIDFGDGASIPAKGPELNEFNELIGLSGLPKSAVRIYEAIIDAPGLRSPVLAALLGVSRSTIANGVAKLKARGLITFEGAPRTGGYFPSET